MVVFEIWSFSFSLVIGCQSRVKFQEKNSASPSFNRISLHPFIRKLVHCSVEPGFRKNSPVEPGFRKFGDDPQKKPNFVAKKVKMSSKKKVFSRIHIDTDILQKTGPKLAIFSLYGPIYNLPPPYRGFPPCAIFHNPDDREI